MRRFHYLIAAAAALAGVTLLTGAAPEGPPGGGGGGGPTEPAELPPFAEVSKGYEKVVTTVDSPGLYALYRRDKDQQLLAELPKEFEGKKFFVTGGVSGGDIEAGVFHAYTRWGGNNDRYVHWKRVNNRLMLLEPNLDFRTSGDAESKRSVERVYTDRVVLDVPILAMGAGGGPVIDLDAMLLGNAARFFGEAFIGKANLGLARIVSAKAFPLNVEIEFSLPVRDGQLVNLHYSISSITGTPGYQPRQADRRIGFFYVNYFDRAKNDGDSQVVRHVARWNLEKADPKLKVSPPKKPIVFYIEHTTPVRYRPWVRQALLDWNPAFEKVGIVNAIEVYQQDANSNAHMEKDPEDARYNFIRWTNSHPGYAIGPSRVNPETGEIFDADIVMDESFLSLWGAELMSVMADAAMSGMDAETHAWLDANPEFDPKIALAAPCDRSRLIAERAAQPTHAKRHTDEAEFATQGMRHSCEMLRGAGASVALGRLMFDAGVLEMDPSGNDQILDGIPEWFIGPMVRYVVCHEVGHTLGLMHNFKASSIYTVEQINSPEWKGKKPLAGSVMDYLATNLMPGGREKTGDPAIIGIGPYDYWAIEWGYTFADPLEVAKRAADPELAFLSDEGASSPDPGTRVWELSADTIEWARQQIRLVEEARGKLVDKYVKDGQSWQRARIGYSALLANQLQALMTAANWVGGGWIARDRKGDPNGRDPYTVVPVDQQRDALKLIVENGFRDASFGLTPELLAKLGSDQWFDADGYGALGQAEWPVADNILGLQSSVLTRLMNPTVLRRVIDNELRTPTGQEMLSVPELMKTLRAEIWSEVAASGAAAASYSERKPLISTLRRNLQRNHLNRLIALATGSGWPGSSAATIQTLARQELRELRAALEKAPAERLDGYSKAHISDALERIRRAMEATYIQQG